MCVLFFKKYGRHNDSIVDVDCIYVSLLKKGYSSFPRICKIEKTNLFYTFEKEDKKKPCVNNKKYKEIKSYFQIPQTEFTSKSLKKKNEKWF